MADRTVKFRYTVDVCRACGRLALWPFCEHRPERWVPDQTKSWCMPITVVATRASAVSLAKEMEETR